MTMLPPEDEDSLQGINTPGEEDTEFQAFLDSLGGSFEYRGNDTLTREEVNEETPNDDLSETPPVPGEDTEVEEDVTPGANPPAPPVSTVLIGDEEVPLSEVQQLYELGKTIRESGLQAPTPSMSGVQAPPPAVETPPVPAPNPTPPSYIDPDDEVQMGLWRELQEVRQQVATTASTVQQTAVQQARARADAALERALSAYRTKYPSVTDDDLRIIRPQAALIVDPMIRQHGEVDGMEQALYVASLAINDQIRNKVLGIDTTPPEQKSQTRKRKLSALSGSSGSAPKTTPNRPQYTSDRDVVNAMARELADSTALNGRIN